MSRANVVRYPGNRRPVQKQDDVATIVILPVVRKVHVETVRLSRDDLIKLTKLGRVVEGRIRNIRKNGKLFDVTVESKSRA